MLVKRVPYFLLSAANNTLFARQFSAYPCLPVLSRKSEVVTSPASLIVTRQNPAL
jgi:hypothetical protein